MSEPYIVSARKYRPQTFDTVVGQAHITTTLKNAIRNQHLAHAYLFCGPRGVGKTTCARILARTINCENPTTDTEACGACPSCVSFSGNASFNIFELDAASNNSVEDIRELVNQVRFAPQQGKYKIYIIDEVHMLSAAAFNAFLKTLEEPPSYAIFILATTEKHKILPTILSRCQIFDFKRITTEDIVSHLQDISGKEGMNAQESALHVIAQKSEGCMRDALSILDRIAGFTDGELSYAATMEHLNILDADFYFGMTDLILSQDVSGILLQLDEVLNRGFEGDVVIGGLAEHFRNLLLCKDQRMTRLLDVPKEYKPVYYEKALQAPPSFLLTALHILNEGELNYKNAVNRRLHVEMCLIRLCYALQATRGEKKNAEAAGSPGKEAALSAPPPSVSVKKEEKQASPQQLQQAAPVNAPAAAALSAMPPPSAIPRPDAPAENAPRRLRKSLITDLDKVLDTSAAVSATPEQALTSEQVSRLFKQYTQQLAAENKSVYHAQFCMMKAEKAGADEVHILSPSDLTETYAREHRDRLIEFFRAETGIRIRVTTSVSDDPAARTDQPVVLSKNEIFAQMVEKNPVLQQLRDSLNLQIVY